ncbi:hypothetical protein [Gordonia effusa]|uniref:hypothetical protein n=1 Tax=Gordonia effusa TaxID=263908 RepID=UPI00110F8603|nr:hypothetical protein [Gordonia effusa]
MTATNTDWTKSPQARRSVRGGGLLLHHPPGRMVYQDCIGVLAPFCFTYACSDHGDADVESLDAFAAATPRSA